MNISEIEKLTLWLEERADDWDRSAELWAEGAPEAINDRNNAIKYRRVVALIAHVRELERQVKEKDGLLLWALYFHQGATSHVGLPIRRALGIGEYDRLTDEQIATAKRAALNKEQPNE